MARLRRGGPVRSAPAGVAALSLPLCHCRSVTAALSLPLCRRSMAVRAALPAAVAACRLVAAAAALPAPHHRLAPPLLLLLRFCRFQHAPARAHARTHAHAHTLTPMHTQPDVGYPSLGRTLRFSVGLLECAHTCTHTWSPRQQITMWRKPSFCQRVSPFGRVRGTALGPAHYIYI